MKKHTYCCFIVALVVFLLADSGAAYAVAPYSSYTYSSDNMRPVPSPPPYLPSKVIRGEQIGVGSFNKPSDLFVSKDKKIYILDSGNNRIVILNDQFQRVDVFEADLNNPQGMFVTVDGMIYVADTGNSRIVMLDQRGSFVSEILTPESEFLPADFVFSPLKLAVDKAKRVYTVANNVFDGLMEFNSEGYFLGFTGANKVRPNMVEYIWKRYFSTKKQKSSMKLILPTEFDNLDIDDEGFIYTVTSTTSTTEPVRRQNASGDNILRVQEDTLPPVGDIRMPNFRGTARGPSTFIDIAHKEYGIFSTLDSKRGRIFTYGSDAELLYTFGSTGNVEGTFKQPVAIDYLGDDILVLDKAQGQFTVFEPTPFAALTIEALRLHNRGSYTESAESWKQVAMLNVNSEFAYTGIGKALLRENKYAEAMINFKLGNNRKYYSKAFKLYREELIREHLNESLLLILGLLLAYILYSKGLKVWIRKRRAAM